MSPKHRPSHSRSDSYTALPDAGPATPSPTSKRQSRHSRNASLSTAAAAAAAAATSTSASPLNLSTDSTAPSGGESTVDANMPAKTSSSSSTNAPIVTPPPRPDRRRPRSSRGIAGARNSLSPTPAEDRNALHHDDDDDDGEEAGSDSAHEFMELPAPLPDDVVSCHTLLITLHSTYEALFHDHRETNDKLRRFRDEASDAAALRSIVDEMLPGLKAQLEDERRKREEEEQSVRDLRQRVEEQRRAMMRLQGQGSSIVGAATNNNNNNNNNGTVTGRDVNKRRSVLGGLPGWMGAGAGASSLAGAADDEESTTDTAPTTSDEAEVMRKSKRASLAFGGGVGGVGGMQARPGSALGSRPTLGSQHRRTTSSGSASGAAAGGAGIGGGLRELRLGGAPGSAVPPSTSLLNAPHSDVISNGGASSRRSSAHSAASGIGSALLGGNPSQFLSPASQTSDLPAAGGLGIGSSADEALRNGRRDTMASDYSEASNFSQLSAAGGGPSSNQLGLSPSGGGLAGGPFATSTGTNGLGLARPPSVSPSQSGLQSPILEGDEQERTYGDSRFGNGEPTPTPMVASLTLRGTSGAPANGTSVFTGQQRVASERTLLELSTKLKSRETEVAHLKRLQMDLERQLDEANEARQASDICLKALREFVANSDAGNGDKAKETMEGIKLPPLPTDRNVDEQEDTNGSRKGNAATAGWTSRIGAGWRGLSSHSNATATSGASPGSPVKQLARSDSQSSGASAGAGAGTSAASRSPTSPNNVRPLPPAAPARTSSTVSALSLASMFGGKSNTSTGVVGVGAGGTTTVEETSSASPARGGNREEVGASAGTTASSTTTTTTMANGTTMPTAPAPVATSSTAAPSGPSSTSTPAATGKATTTGFGGWFKRNSTLNTTSGVGSDSGGGGAPSSATATATTSAEGNSTSNAKHLGIIASPPFSSLDHSVLSPTLETTTTKSRATSGVFENAFSSDDKPGAGAGTASSPTTPLTAVPSAGPGVGVAPTPVPVPVPVPDSVDHLMASKNEIRPHARAARNASRTEHVSEDAGFVGPVFD